jgi:O-antigen ligase
VAALLLLVAIHLIPLPDSWWRALPGRDHVERGYALLGMPPTALPLTLDRDGTIASALAIIPPAAMFLLVLQMGDRARRRLAWVVLAFAAFSIVLGAFQLIGGPESRLRFYAITNRTVPVGFFSNTNHLATLVLSALPFAGFLAARSLSRGAGGSRRGSGVILSGSIAVFLAVGLGAIGSLAGYALFLPAALAALLVYKRATGPLGGRWLAALAVVFAMFLGLALAGPVNEQALSGKVGSASSRRAIAERTIDAVGDFFPAGSGLGTFQNVYRLYDDPNLADKEYVNHAHSDYLEVALELGLSGILLVLAFVLWWLSRTLQVWRREFPGSALARAGSVVVGVVLLHSLVDYPIRTAAIAALFGCACALLLPPRKIRERPEADEGRESSEGLRHLQAN